MQQNGAAMPPPKALNGRYIMNAIRRLGGSSGSAIAEIKKYLQKEKKLECDTGSIKLWLKNAVERGNVSVLDGKYKVNETARRRRRSSGGSSKRRRSRKSGSKRSGSRKRRSSGSKRRRRRSKKADEYSRKHES